jgi:hypothetical protein
MSCILYRKGKGTIEHGIECESTTCEAGHVDGLINAGWSTSPPGYVAPDPVEPVAEPVEPESIDNLKTGLDAEIDNLKEQNRILTELDETSKSELARLTREVETLTGTIGSTSYDLATSKAAVDELTEERDNLLASVERLNSELALLDVDGKDDVVDPDAALHPVRLAAKEKGIDGWDSKRIGTLEKMLEA